MADCSNLPSLGQADSLRPGAGWNCVFTSGVINQFPPGTSMGAEREVVRYFTVAGKTWTDEFTPQDLYNNLAAQNHPCSWIEVWENPPSLGIAGNDDFMFIAIYQN